MIINERYSAIALLKEELYRLGMPAYDSDIENVFNGNNDKFDMFGAFKRIARGLSSHERATKLKKKTRIPRAARKKKLRRWSY